MFKRILIAVDESGCSRLAARTGLAFAKRTGSEVVFAHAIEPRGFAASDWAWMTYRQRKEHGEGLLERFSSEATIGVKTHLVESEGVVKGITELARRLKCDLIFTGTHGRVGFERLMLGSVAEGIARQATVPVMLVRRTSEHAEGEIEFRKVLVSTDGSSLSNEALMVAKDLASSLDAELFVVHVMPDPGLPPAVGATPIDSSALQNDLRLHGKGVLNEAIRELGYARAHPLLVGAHGRRVSEVIEQVARDRDADLIVMGTHGRSGLDRLVLGSVAQSVAHTAHLPVLLVRGGQVSASVGGQSGRQDQAIHAN